MAEELRFSADGQPSLNDGDCPICWRSDVKPLLHGKCGHEFCRPCLERHMLSPSLPTSPDRFVTADTVVTPTLNLCPICRERVSIYDIVRADTKKEVYHSTDFRRTPLAGAIFSRRRCVDKGSYHFPPHKPDDDFDQPDQPYYSLSMTSSAEKYPIENVTLHVDSRTVAGSVKVPGDAYAEWCFYMTLDKSWQHVRRGIIIKRRRKLASEDIGDVFPFDGVWCVQAGLPGNDGESTTRIEIVGNTYYDIIGDLHLIGRRNNVGPITILNLATGDIVFEFLTPWDWREKKGGPPAGTILDAKSTNGVFKELVKWRRDTVSNKLPPDQVNTMGGKSGNFYRRILKEQQLKPEYNGKSIWGNIFCQSFAVGFASYHFLDADNIYTSYEHRNTGRLETNANSSLPNRLKFRDTSFPDPHTFNGKLLWLEDYGVAFDNTDVWEYVIRFDKNFTCILEGTIRCFYQGQGKKFFSVILGRSPGIVYINAAMYDRFAYELKTRSAKKVWALGHERKLAKQNADVKVVEMLHKVFVKASLEAGDPVDYNTEA